MTALHHAPIPEPESPLPSADGTYVSEQEYWETWYETPDQVYEWSNGILEERPMGDWESFLMYDWFYFLLREHLETHPMGDLTGLEIGFRLAIEGSASIRRPDLALILRSNPVRMRRSDRTYAGIFDMCFEFLSDSTPEMAERDTVTKKAEYCRSGVKEYFILDRKGRETAFYRLRGDSYTPILPTPDGLIRSEVLPGFQFREADLYARPSWEKMADDPAYRHFVRKAYQRERQEREEAERLARQERQRAEAAEQQARDEHQWVKKERQRAETAEQQIQQERQWADKERQRAERAEQQARDERQRAEKEHQRAERLAAMLRELGMEEE